MATSIPAEPQKLIDAAVRATDMTTGEAIDRLISARYGESPAIPLLVMLARQDEVTPRLLEEMALLPDGVTAKLAEHETGDHQYILHGIAVYLLALFEEKRAFPLLIRYLAADTHTADTQLSDTVTEDLTAIIARTYDGSDLAPVKAIIDDPDANIYVRSALLEGLNALVRRGQLDRSETAAYFADVLRLCCSEPHHAFAELAIVDAARFKDKALLPLIDRIYDAGLIDTKFAPRRDIDAYFNDPQDTIDQSLLQSKRFDSLIDYICGWSWFTAGDAARPIGSDGGAVVARTLAWQEANTYTPKAAKIGRNDPCHCGSAKKYKKCCLERDQFH